MACYATLYWDVIAHVVFALMSSIMCTLGRLNMTVKICIKIPTPEKNAKQF